MYQFVELFWNAIHSTPQGYLGVSLIYAYMALILAVAIYRIARSWGHH
jgi:hypothetical protein